MPLKETETLELKRSTSSLDDALISLSSMLNKHGQGEVVFGVEDSGKAVGQDIGKTTIPDISRSISEHVEPKIFPAIHEEEIDGKRCIRVKASGNQAPYFAFGRAYMRVGDKDLLLSARELEGLFVVKNKETLRWDNKPCPNARAGDIDIGKLMAFLQKANLDFESVDISLLKLGLMAPDGITNTAILLFSDYPQKFIPNSELRCAVFGGSGTARILDRKEFRGDLFTLVDEAQAYVNRNTHLGMRLEGMARVDVPEIDESALREAIINAFCHRDYHNPDTVNIAVFTDRVEIRSPGRLYGGLTLETITHGGVPHRRNELLAEMLHRIRYIERWGRGIGLILEKEPTATFKEVGQVFITVFKRKNVPEKVPESSVEKGPKSAGKVPKEMPKKYLKILELVQANPAISIIALAKEMDMSLSTIRSGIRILAKSGLLKHVGPKKGGHWEFIKR